MSRVPSIAVTNTKIMRAFCWNNNNTNNTFKQALNYLKNTFKNFREKYIDNFREILMACLPTPLVFLQVLFFHQLVKIYSSFSQREDNYFRQTNEKRYLFHNKKFQLRGVSQRVLSVTKLMFSRRWWDIF